MIKLGLALGSGLFFVAIAVYFGNKKEEFIQVKTADEYDLIDSENKYKTLLESIY